MTDHISSDAEADVHMVDISFNVLPWVREAPIIDVDMEPVEHLQFQKCVPVTSLRSAEKEINGIIDRHPVTWLSLHRLEAPARKGGPLGKAENDVLYFRKTPKSIPADLDAKKLFWAGEKNPRKIPSTNEELCKFLDEELAETAATGRLIPYWIDADPDLCPATEKPAKRKSSKGTKSTKVNYARCKPPRPKYAKTPLDLFIKNVDPQKNEALGDRGGVTRPTINIGASGSFSSTHGEDGNLDSGNIVQSGDRKLWLVVPPEHYSLLNRCIRDFLDRCTDPKIKGRWGDQCNLPIHHKDLVIPPSFLIKYGIPFEIFVQNPGDFVYIWPLCVHFVWNVGPNKCVATNIGSRFWNRIAHLFVTCRCKHNGNTPVHNNANSGDPQTDRFWCPVKDCHAFFVKQATLQEHILEHKNPGVRLRCTFCQRYIGSSGIGRHLERCTSTTKGSVCPTCSGCFAAEFLKYHSRVCDLVRVCLCGRSDFATGAALTNHQRCCPEHLNSLKRPAKPKPVADEGGAPTRACNPRNVSFVRRASPVIASSQRCSTSCNPAKRSRVVHDVDRTVKRRVILVPKTRSTPTATLADPWMTASVSLRGANRKSPSDPLGLVSASKPRDSTNLPLTSATTPKPNVFLERQLVPVPDASTIHPKILENFLYTPTSLNTPGTPLEDGTQPRMSYVPVSLTEDRNTSSSAEEFISSTPEDYVPSAICAGSSAEQPELPSSTLTSLDVSVSHSSSDLENKNVSASNETVGSRHHTIASSSCAKASDLMPTLSISNAAQIACSKCFMYQGHHDCAGGMACVCGFRCSKLSELRNHISICPSAIADCFPQGIHSDNNSVS
ncbi:hypothetical protein QAD02_018427 [Eretmocerus hayati]|uniref:Uncharacterized protein n=1 Tax=Eretmocerus hayati TaxID=131215 RepID=A0ACC2PLH7_9HYME|nr:hypothetical protein QAD02_018427 [Eretmocerus hayati]